MTEKPASRRVTGVEFTGEPYHHPDIRQGGFSMAWTADDRRIAAVSDGVDLSDPPRAVHCSAFEVVGDPPEVEFRPVPGFPYMPLRLRESAYASYWGGNALAIGNRIYAFQATSSVPYLTSEGDFWPDFFLAHSKLIYSPDGGETWHNQDGSTPVVWEDWDARSADNMAFYDEKPEGAFAEPTFLQMGRGYEQNQDGYAYLYSSNGGEDGTANQLVMLRVPTEHLLDRTRYEYFTGLADTGEATWTSDIEARGVVHTFPRGWVAGKMPGAVPAGWLTSVAYIEPLGLYLLAGQGNGAGPNGGWFAKPSYLGFWTAPTPWGPFTQVHEDTAWTPGGRPESRAFMPQIAPQWIAPDGESFWLVWSDYAFDGELAKDDNGQYNPDRAGLDLLGHITDDVEFGIAFKKLLTEGSHLNGFNAQKVVLRVE